MKGKGEIGHPCLIPLLIKTMVEMPFGGKADSLSRGIVHLDPNPNKSNV